MDFNMGSYHPILPPSSGVFSTNGVRMDFYVDVDNVTDDELDRIVFTVLGRTKSCAVEIYRTSPGSYCLVGKGSILGFNDVLKYLKTLDGIDKAYLYFTEAKGVFNRRVSKRIDSLGNVKSEPVLVNVVRS